MKAFLVVAGSVFGLIVCAHIAGITVEPQRASGEAAVILPGALHAVRALKDAQALVVDCPRRESIAGIDL